jgi:predicted MFS family arabinose efflux permease
MLVLPSLSEDAPLLGWRSNFLGLPTAFATTLPDFSLARPEGVKNRISIIFSGDPLTQLNEPVNGQNRLTTFFGLSIQIIAIVFLARLTMDTGTRSVYPFIPQISAGLGLSIVGFSWLIFIRSIAGLAGPLFGLLADRYSRRKIMALGLLCQAVGVLGLALTRYWWAALPMILFGLSLAAFIPAQQAYISDQVAYQKRGRALAAIEFAWALAGIISLPIIGWLIDIFGWQAPFLILALVSLCSATVCWLRLPAADHHSHISLTLAQVWEVSRQPNIIAGISVELLLFVAVSNFITVWSIWLSADFGLGATALGLVATGIGLAELAGSGSSSLFIDRIGKRRGSQIGLFITAIAFLLLPFTQFSLFAAISGLTLFGILIEFTVVSLIPLYAEQVPQARATVFSLVAFGASIGIAIGSPLTASLWDRSGLWAVCAVAAGCLLLALGLVTRFLRDEVHSSTDIIPKIIKEKL